MYKNAGFTLIELLVVVLIIGILAAVALPQYQKAVIKSRYVSRMNWVDSIAQAQELYYLANGHYAVRFEDLDITVPTGLVPWTQSEGGETVWNQKSGVNHLNFAVGAQYTYMTMVTAYGSMEYVRYYAQTGNRRLCYAGINGEPLKKICISLGGTLRQVVPTAWNIYLLP